VARTGLRMMPTFLPPKIPNVGFSTARFQCRYVRRCLPVDYEFVASQGSPPSFVHLATCNAASSLGVEGRSGLLHHRSSGHCRFTPGAFAPVRVIGSPPIFTYSAPCAPRVADKRS
jgi:hypothetical protein